MFDRIVVGDSDCCARGDRERFTERHVLDGDGRARRCRRAVLQSLPPRLRLRSRAAVAVSVVLFVLLDPPHAVTIAAIRLMVAKNMQIFFIVSPNFFVLPRHDCRRERVQSGPKSAT